MISHVLCLLESHPRGTLACYLSIVCVPSSSSGGLSDSKHSTLRIVEHLVTRCHHLLSRGCSGVLLVVVCIHRVLLIDLWEAHSLGRRHGLIRLWRGLIIQKLLKCLHVKFLNLRVVCIVGLGFHDYLINLLLCKGAF